METLKDFIFSQSDECLIDMCQSGVTDDARCGCVLIHFGRAHGLNGKMLSGFDYVRSIGDAYITTNKVQPANSRQSSDIVNPALDERVTTYGQLKRLIIKYSL